jgi:Flp pilus assembly protein TadG
MVEFAFVLPLLLALLLGIVQIGLAFNHYVMLTDAARVGARSAITVRTGGSTPADAVEAVRQAAGSLDQNDLQVTVDDPDWNDPGSQITVVASYPYSIDIPFVGVTLASGTISATAEERLQ